MFRALPETEIPPVSRGDIYFFILYFIELYRLKLKCGKEL